MSKKDDLFMIACICIVSLFFIGQDVYYILAHGKPRDIRAGAYNGVQCEVYPLDEVGKR